MMKFATTNLLDRLDNSYPGGEQPFGFPVRPRPEAIISTHPVVSSVPGQRTAG